MTGSALSLVLVREPSVGFAAPGRSDWEAERDPLPAVDSAPVGHAKLLGHGDRGQGGPAYRVQTLEPGMLLFHMWQLMSQEPSG
jgi:hypothetical protein